MTTDRDMKYYINFFKKNIGETIILITAKSRKAVKIVNVNNNFVLFETATYKESHNISAFLCGEVKWQSFNNNLAGEIKDVYKDKSVDEEILAIKNNILNNLFETDVYKGKVYVKSKNEIIQSKIVSQFSKYRGIFDADDLFNESYIIFQDVLTKHKIKDATAFEELSIWKHLQDCFADGTNDKELQKYLNQFYSHFAGVLHMHLWEHMNYDLLKKDCKINGKRKIYYERIVFNWVLQDIVNDEGHTVNALSLVSNDQSLFANYKYDDNEFINWCRNFMDEKLTDSQKKYLKQKEYCLLDDYSTVSDNLIKITGKSRQANFDMEKAIKKKVLDAWDKYTRKSIDDKQIRFQRYRKEIESVLDAISKCESDYDASEVAIRFVRQKINTDYIADIVYEMLLTNERKQLISNFLHCETDFIIDGTRYTLKDSMIDYNGANLLFVPDIKSIITHITYGLYMWLNKINSYKPLSSEEKQIKLNFKYADGVEYKRNFMPKPDYKTILLDIKELYKNKPQKIDIRNYLPSGIEINLKTDNEAYTDFMNFGDYTDTMLSESYLN